MKRMKRFYGLFAIAILLVMASPFRGDALNFSIRPIRVFFDSLHKTNVLTIKNESPEDVSLQLRAYEWSQDERGENVYKQTKEIIFFPKILTLKKGEEKIVRLGTRIPRGDVEKTYRLFIEEIPSAGSQDSTAVKIVMKVGVPLFVTPLKTQAEATVESAELKDGRLDITVRNTGNVHFIVKTLRIRGFDSSGSLVLDQKRSGRYLHAGNTRDFTIDIPEDSCRLLDNIDIDIDTDRLSIRKKLGIQKDMCRI